MLTLGRFAGYEIVPRPAWVRGTKAIMDANALVTRSRVILEGLEHLPATPALLATNSTQKYDFMPIRWALHDRAVKAVTITKAKNYHSPAFAHFLGKTGVVPLASRGYFLVLDFQLVHGRRPTEDEYRALRAHVDDGTPLPDGGAFEVLQTRPRELLGDTFSPGQETYRELLARLYRRMMSESLRLCREAMDAGYHVQIYPEGTVSTHLARGRIGAVQFAVALGVPIVPVGMSGCREGMRSAFLGGGEIRVRFGAPYVFPRATLPDDFRAFEPEHERTHKAVLQAETDALMARIDPLLDPPYRTTHGFRGDGTQGTRRFL
jgi:1-acyl-sn-glycerol-3-phosphate acyltransferase